MSGMDDAANRLCREFVDAQNKERKADKRRPDKVVFEKTPGGNPESLMHKEYTGAQMPNMTKEQQQIEAAKAAMDKATPGPLDVIFTGTMGKYLVEKTEGSVHKQLAYCGLDDALLFAAAPALARRVIELEDQLKKYELALAETEALVFSHEGHITKLESSLATIKSECADRAAHWFHNWPITILESEYASLRAFIMGEEK